MAIVRAAVIKRGTKDFLLRPSVVFLEAGDVFRLVNTTSYEVRLASSSRPGGAKKKVGALLGLSRRRPFRTVKKGGVFDLAVGVPAPAGGWKPQNLRGRYEVVVNVAGELIGAVGDSDPVIIIDNP